MRVSRGLRHVAWAWCAVIAVVALFARPALGQNVGTLVWTGAVSGDWSDPGNWTLTDGVDVDADGLPSHTGNESELIVFHADGATNLNTFLSATMDIGALHFSAGASSTVTVGGLQGNGGDDSLTPVRLIINGSHTSDFFPVDILVPSGQHHVIQGAAQGSGAGNEDLVFDFAQVWEVQADASLTIAARIRQANNTRTTFEKTGAGTLILAANNGGSSSWQFGNAAQGQIMTISEGTLMLAASGARGNSSNGFYVASGGTVALKDIAYGSSNGLLTLNGPGAGGVGAFYASEGAENRLTPSSTVGQVVIESSAAVGVADGAVLLWDHGIEAASGGDLTKVGAGTMIFRTNNELPDYGYAGSVTVAQGTLLVNAQAAAQTLTGSTTNGSTTLTVADNTSLSIGQPVSGPGIAPGTFIVNMGATNAVLSQAATADGADQSFDFAGVASALNTSAVAVQSGATLGGTGSINGSAVTVDAGGVLAPGASVGSFSVGSALLNGTLAIEFNGDTGEIDLLRVVGQLDITAATLELSNIGSAALAGGAFVFAEYGSLEGAQFASAPSVPAGFELDYNYQNANQIALVSTGVLTPMPDLNMDGKVDIFDVAIVSNNWANAGAPGTVAGDANKDGTVDIFDVALISNNWNPGGGAQAVPEPGALALVLCQTLIFG